jgi:5-formyltetrahydrofolate cyclo-ligase
MKNVLRKKYKLLRKSFTEKQKNEFSKIIYNTCINNFDLENKNISIFIPIAKFNEIDTWHFLNKLTANYFLPVVQNKKLKHIRYENKEQLKLSDWGILEPTFGEEVVPAKFDIVIIPLLAYDNCGNRIGYGAGFYDGFLKDCNPKCKFIGVSFFEPEIETIETYQSDIPLHYCVTPTKIHHYN